MSLEPRVYIACLACYNAGKLHGEWFDADNMLLGSVESHFQLKPACYYCDAPEAEHAAPDWGGHDFKRGGMFASCGGEEFLVHDHEGFGPLEIGECSVEEAARVGHWLKDQGDDAELIAAFHEHRAGSDMEQGELDVSASEFAEKFQGSFDSLEEWAEDFHESIGDIPKGSLLANYIDWERVARDAELGGDIFTIELDGKVHVFWNH